MKPEDSSWYPKIFRDFLSRDLGYWNGGYIVLADAAVIEEPVFQQLEEYAKIHNLMVDES